MRAGLKGTVLNMLLIVIKGIVHPKIIILSLLYHTVMLYQTCSNFCLVLNTNPTGFDSRRKIENMEVTGNQQLFGFPH